jgi:hypothetical protein
MAARNAAGAPHEISPAVLRPTMAFLRALHEQLLSQKRREGAKRAASSVLERRRK